MAGSQRSISTRLTTEGAQRAAQEFERFGERGQQALKRVELAAGGTSRGLLALDAASGTLGRGLGALYSRFFSLNAVVATVGGSAGLGLVARSAIGTAVEISTMARQAGIGAEALQEMTHVSQRAKVGFDAMVDGLKELQLRADEFIVTGKGPAAEAFQRLGLSKSEIQNRLQAPADLLEEIIERVGALDRAAQIRILDELLGGTAGEQFIRFTDLGAAGIRRLREEAHDLGLVLEDDVLRGAERVADQFADLSRTAQLQFQRGFLAEFTGEFENLSDLIRDPEFQEGIRNIGSFFGGISRFAVENAETVGRTAGALAGLKAGAAFPGPPQVKAGAALLAAGAGYFAPDIFDAVIADAETLQTKLADVREEIAKIEGELAGEGDGIALSKGKQAAGAKKLEELRQQAEALQRGINEEAQAEATRAMLSKERAAAESTASAEAQRQLEIAAEREVAEKEHAAERKRALADIARLEEQAALAGLDGIAKLAVERDLAIEKHRERLEKQIITEAEFNQARLKEEEKYQKEKAEIEEDAAEKARQDRLKAIEKASADIKREQEKAAREQEREAERQAELMQEPFKNALEGIQDSFTDFFDNVLSGGVDSFEDLADEVKRVWTRLISELASQQLSSAILGGGTGTGTASAGLGNFGGIFSGIGSLFGGGSTPAAQLGAAASTGRAGGVGTAGVGGGFLSGGAGGLSGAVAAIPVWGWIAAAAMTAKSFVEGSKPGSFGGVLDTLLLPSIEQWQANPGRSAVNALDPIGTVIGDVFGNDNPLMALLSPGAFLGGLFGGGKSIGPNSGAAFTVVDGKLQVRESRADNGGNPENAGGIGAEVANAVNFILGELGGSLTRRGISGVGEIGGNYFVRGPGNYDSAKNTKFGRDFEAAANFATLQTLQHGRFAGFEAAEEEAVRLAARFSADLEDFAVNFAVASGILGDDLFDVEELTAAEQAIEALNAQFEDATERAEKMGLSLAKLDDLREEALADLTTGFDEGIRLQLLALTDPVAAALEQHRIVAEQRLKEAAVLGADLVEVEKLNALERQRVLEQAGGDLKRFFEEITFGSLSGIAPGAGVEAQRAAFDAAAASGNVAEINRLGRGLLGSARTAFASGPQYQEILGRVQEVVGSHVAANGMDNMNATLTQGFGQSISMFQQMVTELAAVRVELTALRQDNARLNSLLEERAA